MATTGNTRRGRRLMKKTLAMLTITAMFFGALGLGLLAFPSDADAGTKCLVIHQDENDEGPQGP